MADTTLNNLTAKTAGAAALLYGAVSPYASGDDRKVAMSAAGAVMLEAADAAAQRTALGLGTAALLGTANVFTAAQTISTTGTCLTLGSGAGNAALAIRGTGATVAFTVGFGDSISIGAQIIVSNGVALTGGSLMGRNSSASVYLPSASQIGFGSTGDNTGSNDAFLMRKAAATLQLGADAAGVTNQMFTAASRITSDGVGANLTIAPGNGRGGAGGSLILSTYTTGASGVTGTLTPRLYINGPDGLLQFGGQSAAFCALKGDTTLLEARLADDSGYASFGAGVYYSDGLAGVSASGSSISSIVITNGIVTAISIS
jgi:hypothetical protein